MSDDDVSATQRFEEALRRSDQQHFVLRLYVAGATAASRRAIANLTAICQRHLQGRYSLEVIDISKRPSLAAGEQIIAAPTLIRLLPEPIARVVGDLSDEHKVLVGLDLWPRDG